MQVTNMLPPRELADLYRTSRLVFFPMATVGGGERALLEVNPFTEEVTAISRIVPVEWNSDASE